MGAADPALPHGGVAASAVPLAQRVDVVGTALLALAVLVVTLVGIGVAAYLNRDR